MSKGKILLCEDSELMVHMTKFVLQAEGFEVESVSSANEILPKIKTFPPHIILMDLNLSEDGVPEVINQLKTQKESEKVPVILFSGEENLSEIAKNLHADGYIQKPFNVADLISTVRKFVPRLNNE